MPRSEPIKAVRGMRDILPRGRPIWRAAEHAAEDVARRFGYEEIVTPLIEHAELIERVGEDTDAVAKELYRFEDRGGRKLALRPDPGGHTSKPERQLNFSLRAGARVGTRAPCASVAVVCSRPSPRMAGSSWMRTRMRRRV